MLAATSKYHVISFQFPRQRSDAKTRYHVPASVSSHIDYITPGIKLYVPTTESSQGESLEKRTFGVTGGKPLPPLLKALPDALSNLLQQGLRGLCQMAIIPGCIDTLYQIPQGTKAAKGNELGIFEDLGEWLHASTSSSLL